MRLLYWTTSYWPSIGGMEVIGTKLLSALRARGYDICVVTSHGHLDLPDEDERDGISIRRLPFHRALESRDPLLTLETQRRLAQVKRDFGADVVHVNPSDPSVIFHVRTMAASQPAKIVVTLHVPVPEQLCGPDTLFGKTLRAADWVTTVSEGQLTALRRLVPELAPTSSVILNGAEMSNLDPRPLPIDPPRLLCAGRLVAEKGFDVAIAAFASIAARWPGARLVIVGDGPVRAALERQAQEVGIAHRTDFVGWVAPADVPSLMNDATIVLMPSRWEEPFGLVAMEAAQMARPVVASRIGGLPEVVVDGETGMLVSAGDVAALAGAVSWLLERPELAARMGRVARERARLVFGGERYVDEHDQLYRRLVTEEAHAASR